LTVKLIDGTLPAVAADEIPIPALLRAARGAYGGAIRRRLLAAGFDDLPRNGPFVLGGMANHGAAAGDLVRRLGVSKQATAQLVDTLVLRGYLERTTNAEDRRRLDLTPTARGRAAAGEVRAGVLEVDEQLASMLTTAEVETLRKGLFALIAVGEHGEERARG
jgi:DNA-binding MarR family transcriptional regulator